MSTATRVKGDWLLVLDVVKMEARSHFGAGWYVQRTTIVAMTWSATQDEGDVVLWGYAVERRLPLCCTEYAKQVGLHVRKQENRKAADSQAQNYAPAVLCWTNDATKA